MSKQATNIVVFLALPEEHDEFLKMFPAVGDRSDDSHVITEHDARIDGFRLFSILSVGMGDVEAGGATEKVIEKIGADTVVCVGIAGSLSKDLKIGDVAVSNEIIDISQNIKISERPIVSRRRGRKKRVGGAHQRFQQVVELSPKTLQVDNLLSASFRFVRSHPTLKNDHASWVAEATDRRLELLAQEKEASLAEEMQFAPTVEIGPIISGPVVASGAFRQTLKAIDRKMLAVETESAGVFRACAKAQVPCITIRGISDHADVNKNALERTTKNNSRVLAARNAVAYLAIQLKNPKFMAIASRHREGQDLAEVASNSSEPEAVLANVEKGLDAYLTKMSPE